MNATRIFLGLLCLLVMACHPNDHSHEGQTGHAEHNETAVDHGHDHNDDHPARSLTLYSDQHELFMEYPLPLVNQEITLLAHLTRLQGWQAVMEGEAVFEFTHQDGQSLTVRTATPARAGIYLPSVILPKAGNWVLLLRIAGDQLRIHDFEVYHSAHDLPQEADEPGGEISFLKEQQWTIPFMSERVTVQPFYQALPLFGRVKPVSGQRVLIKAPVSGYLSMVSSPAPGEKVTRDQALAVMVPSPQNHAEPDSLKADLVKAQAEESLAQSERDRMAMLVSKEILPAFRLNEAESTLKAKQASVHAARQRVGQLQNTKQREATTPLVLKAPFAGTIVRREAAAGSYVTQGEVLLELLSTQIVWLEAMVPESQTGKLTHISGLTLNGQIIPLGEKARLVQIGSSLDPETRTLPLLFEVPNPNGALIPGTTLALELLLGEPEPLLAIPEKALVFDGGVRVAYVQTGGESFQRRVIQTGVSSAGKVTLLAGIGEGERLVTEGGYLIRLSSLSNSEAGHGHAH